MINLNNPTEFTLDRIRQLIHDGNDSVNNQIRVTNEGILFLSQEVGGENLGNLLFRLETFFANNGYVGQEAANDAEWIQRLFDTIKKNWPTPSSTYIDTF